ncbi:MAG TPA: aspartate aminotransferase family protein, partial [Candidatus Dormibacteraeota bacterium]
TRLAGGLRRLEAESPYVSFTRGVGMMLGFDLVDPETGDLAGPELSQRLFLSCLEHGLLIAQVPRVRLNAPLTLRPDEADAALEALAAALAPEAVRG